MLLELDQPVADGATRHAEDARDLVVRHAVEVVVHADLDELRGLAAEALEITGRPGLRVQALGVLLWAAPELSEGYRPALEALIAQIPPLLARGRRELMTVDGALSGVEGLARPA